MPELHDELIAVDGLIIAPRCSPTCAAAASSRANAPARSRTALIDHSEFRPVQARFRAHPDVILQVRTTEDIQRAKREGKTGIVLGFQNVSAFEDAELIAQRPGPAVGRFNFRGCLAPGRDQRAADRQTDRYITLSK